MNLTLVVIIFALPALLFLIFSAARLRRRRWLAAGGHGVFGMVFAAIAALLVAFAINLHTYHRLTYERPAAKLSFERTGPNAFLASVSYPTGETERYRIDGDEWQLDARILKWKGAANLLGLDAQYRLERLSGRYRDIERERRAPHSVYSLAESAGLDVWALAQRHQRWLPWVDATYGSATYLPIADDAVYRVHVTQSGLIARPANETAEQAVRQWN